MRRLTFLLALCLAAPALAHEGHHHPSAPDCPDAALSCATAATPAFGPDGRLWLAWSAGGRVMVAQSEDRGGHFASPVAVTSHPAAIDDGGEARPKIVPLPDGVLVVSWTVRRDDFYNGTVMLARSTDGGRSFGPARPLAPEAVPTSQRFESLGLGRGGRLYAAWLDKRNVAAAKAAGHDYAGAALATAWSDDGGRTFTRARILADNTCECCRLAMAFGGDGRPVFAWRHIFGTNLRDHAVARLKADGTIGTPRRVSDDDWAIDACPHHGPALAVGGDGSYHVAWYTGSDRRQGLFYAHSEDGGRRFSAPLGFGNPDRAPSHPQLLWLNHRLILAWQEFNGETTEIMAMASQDGGRNWSPPRRLASAADASDHPLLVTDGTAVFLSWLSRKEGYRLIPVTWGTGR